MHVVFGLVFGAVLSVAPAQGDVGFTGAWVRNAEKSDDPHEAMQEAMEQMREQMRGRARGGRPGGMPPGERPPRGGRAPGAGERPGGPPDLGGAADELDLELAEGELHVDDGERLRIYYLDGEKHLRETANGTKLETVAMITGNAISVQEKMERGQLDRRFELSPDGATMITTVSMKFGRMKEPVLIRTVYERASENPSNE